ncbi:MAG: zinc ribbon domain-containing protein [Promethearchaeia archaeon]
MKEKGKHLILIDRYFSSSKICSKCGYKNKALALKDREWICPNCNPPHNRDVNASKYQKRRNKAIIR